MLRDSHKDLAPASGNLRGHLPASCATAAVLTKIAKHFGLLGSFAILGEATGRIAVSQLAILTLIVVAALSHTIGRTLELRLRKRTALNKGVP